MLELDLQLATDGQHPDEAQLRRWCELALRQRTADSELTIRLVDEAEGRELNHTWRHRDYATNVLSFPADIPDGILDIPLLGDLPRSLRRLIEEAGERLGQLHEAVLAELERLQPERERRAALRAEAEERPAHERRRTRR